jgi:hypothetical protein
MGFRIDPLNLSELEAKGLWYLHKLMTILYDIGNMLIYISDDIFSFYVLKRNLILAVPYCLEFQILLFLQN